MKYSIFYTTLLLLLFSVEQVACAKEIVLPPKGELERKERGELLELAYEYAESDIFAAQKVLEIAKENAIRSRKQKDLKECFRAMGYIYEEKNMLQKAIEEYLNALLVSEIKSEEKAIICNDIAIAYRKYGDYQKAKIFHQKALSFAEENEDFETREIVYNGLGAFNYTIENNEKAVEFFLKSLKFAEYRPDNELGVIISLRNLAEIYTISKHDNLALQTIEKAYQLAKAKNEKETIARVLISYCNTLSDIGRFEEATQKINEALVLLGDKQEYAESKILALSKLGDIYRQQNNYNKATYYYNLCLAQKDNISEANLCSIYSNFGVIYLNQKKFSTSLSYFEKSLDIANQYHLVTAIQKNHIGMYEVFSGQKNIKMAFFHLEQANFLRDSLQSDEKDKHLAELQMQYDFNKSEKQVEDLKVRENTIKILAACFCCIFILIFLGYIVRAKGKNNEFLLQKSKEIHLQNKKLAESNEVLQQFAYASAHDLKEPLRNIGNFVTLIQRRFGQNLPEEALEYMSYVTKGTKKMNALLEDLLSYATLIANNELLQETSKLGTIIDEIKFNLQANISEKEANINYFGENIEIPISKLHSNQLFQNLLSNAMKFVDDKKPTIEIRYKNTINSVDIEVKDNGIGIEKEYGEKIFNLFQRLNKNDSRYEGTGVGLAICKNIVEKYNGKIWFESEKNKGTTFFISLPSIKVL
jgi:signal transduction histidine kinase